MLRPRHKVMNASGSNPCSAVRGTSQCTGCVKQNSNPQFPTSHGIYIQCTLTAEPLPRKQTPTQQQQNPGYTHNGSVATIGKCFLCIFVNCIEQVHDAQSSTNIHVTECESGIELTFRWWSLSASFLRFLFKFLLPLAHLLVLCGETRWSEMEEMGKGQPFKEH